jgi:tRNA A-37 threonylcarbamoyl transferase component Bud32
VDKAYEVYCFADPVFYDSPTAVLADDDVGFAIARGTAPDGWRRANLDDWIVYAPEDVGLAPQGWKIHVSACLDNAEAILTATWHYCVPRRIPFKFIRNVDFLFIRNTKYADRGSSGKFVTIYPSDEAQLELVLAQLGAILDGQRGPYILSDLRWGAGPLYVRYGGFTDLYCIGPGGEQEPAIIDASGTLVPDRRGPTFQVPQWLTLPAFLEPHLAARAAVKVEEMPYGVERAIHFSNAGGLYVGTDRRSGEQVVLKEARPHAGLSVDRADAITRLRREREMLERLAGLDVVPALRDYFMLGDHEFLVQQFIEGSTLSDLFVRRYPLVAPQLSATVAAEYTAWALEKCSRVERAVEAFHERGIVIGDVHPSNVLVRPDGRIVLIDLEIAADVSEQRRQTLADPGFMAPADRTGFDIDRYALACMRLHMFMPLTTLFDLDRDKARELAGHIGELFPVPPEFLAAAVRTIRGPAAATQRGSVAVPIHRNLDADPASWPDLRNSMAAAIVASATANRDDRLFPGDIKQFATEGIDLAYGAAGVLYALAATDAGRHPELEEWLLQRAVDPQPGVRLGFYDGLHGVAHAFERLGRRDDALKVLDICTSELDGKWEHFGLDLLGGLAGIGLNLTHFATVTGDRALLDLASRVAERAADRLGDEHSVADISGGEHPYAGLVRGSSGPALMFLRLYEGTGDVALLDLAAVALRQDLRRCVEREEDGALEVTEGWRTMPYLADGSVGIGFVLENYLHHRDDDQFATAAAQIRRAAEAQFYIEPGLFYGRAGMILYLSHAQPPGSAAARDPVIAAQVQRLSWHALTYAGQLAFPGEQLLRLSMDLATGTAGVLLALGAALHHEPVHLPFLGPPQAAATEAVHDLVVTTERG